MFKDKAKIPRAMHDPRTAKAVLTVEVCYDPSVTDAEAIAAAADQLLKTVLSTPAIVEEYGNPVFHEFFVQGPVQYAIYHTGTDELMLETFGRFSRLDIATECMQDVPHIAQDLCIVEILGIPQNGVFNEPDEAEEPGEAEEPEDYEGVALCVSQSRADELTLYCCEAGHVRGSGKILFTDECQFSDGYRMQIHVQAGENPVEDSCYTIATLYDSKNRPVDTVVGFAFLGEYLITVPGSNRTYITTVMVGEEPCDEESME